MFRGLINDAKSAAGSVVAKQAARASVVVPFMIALGFATAAAALTLIDLYGDRIAYAILAAAFGLIGLVTALIVRSKEQEVVVADAKAAKAEAVKPDVVSDTVAAVTAAQLPLALIGTLLTGSAGPVSVGGVARLVGRNLPLVLLLAGLGFVLWPQTPAETAANPDGDGADTPTAPRPNGAFHAGALHDAA